MANNFLLHLQLRPHSHRARLEYNLTASNFRHHLQLRPRSHRARQAHSLTANSFPRHLPGGLPPHHNSHMEAAIRARAFPHRLPEARLHLPTSRSIIQAQEICHNMVSPQAIQRRVVTWSLKEVCQPKQARTNLNIMRLCRNRLEVLMTTSHTRANEAQRVKVREGLAPKESGLKVKLGA